MNASDNESDDEIDSGSERIFSGDDTKKNADDTSGYKSHLQFLSSEKLMPFVAAHSIFINGKSCIRETMKKSDKTKTQF